MAGSGLTSRRACWLPLCVVGRTFLEGWLYRLPNFIIILFIIMENLQVGFLNLVAIGCNDYDGFTLGTPMIDTRRVKNYFQSI